MYQFMEPNHTHKKTHGNVDIEPPYGCGAVVSVVSHVDVVFHADVIYQMWPPTYMLYHSCGLPWAHICGLNHCGLPAQPTDSTDDGAAHLNNQYTELLQLKLFGEQHNLRQHKR